MSSFSNRVPQVQFPGEAVVPAPFEAEFLDSPFLRWVKLADMLLSRPRAEEDSGELSN